VGGGAIKRSPRMLEGKKKKKKKNGSAKILPEVLNNPGKSHPFGMRPGCGTLRGAKNHKGLNGRGKGVPS